MQLFYLESRDVVEEIAIKYVDIVYLGVRLHNGYESAQRMYMKHIYQMVLMFGIKTRYANYTMNVKMMMIWSYIFQRN